MKISLLLTGKTEETYLKDGFEIFEKRVKRYLPFQTIVIPGLKNVKNFDSQQIKEKEGMMQLHYLTDADYIMLLDEKGKEFRSVEFASFLQQRMTSSMKHLLFLIGGTYGFSDMVYTKANSKLSISKMTFSHQIVRLLFMEQLFRAFSILRNEPYHNEG